MRDFIGVFEDVLPKDVSREIIARFEASPHRAPGRTGSGFDAKRKLSTDLSLATTPGCEHLVAAVAAAVEGPLLHYVSLFPSLLVGALAPSILVPGESQPVVLTMDDVRSDSELRRRLLRSYFHLGPLNIQKYERGRGGYPHWHSEIFPDPNQRNDKLSRVLFLILYLNNVRRDGETEFLFQDRKIEPREGRLLIAPAGFTHTHRGNVPRGDDKYVVSSWLSFRPFDEIARNVRGDDALSAPPKDLRACSR